MGEVSIVTPSGTVSASVHGSGDRVVALGHGAGSTRTYPALVALAEAIAASGRTALLFNFPYTEAGKGRPDPPDVLEGTIRGVADYARQALGARSLVLGGRSMGGRIASQAVAKGVAAEGLVFLAYPLHPPGRPEQLRDKHLPEIRPRCCSCRGRATTSRAADLLEAVLARLGERATFHSVREGDHSFGVLKRSGRTPAEVREEVHGTVLVLARSAGTLAAPSLCFPCPLWFHRAPEDSWKRAGGRSPGAATSSPT